MHIVIDGYNYIHRVNASWMQKGVSMDIVRRDFLDKCARYKRSKPARITVIFDAYDGIFLGRQSDSHRGVEVIYSQRDETADDVIMGLIRKRPAGLVVVSSDRAIIDTAKANGVSFLTPVAFSTMLQSTKEMAGMEKKENDNDEPRQPKKGNPRKLPKKVRKAVKGIGRL